MEQQGSCSNSLPASGTLHKLFTKAFPRPCVTLYSPHASLNWDSFSLTLTIAVGTLTNLVPADHLLTLKTFQQKSGTLNLIHLNIAHSSSTFTHQMPPYIQTFLTCSHNHCGQSRQRNKMYSYIVQGRDGYIGYFLVTFPGYTVNASENMCFYGNLDLTSKNINPKEFLNWTDRF